MAFQKPDAEQKPRLICVGTLSNIASYTRSKSSDYVYNKCSIKGAGSCPNQTFNLLWLPEFFNPSLSLRSLDSSQAFVYKRTMASGDGQSYLEGLCGSTESWESFQEGAAALEDYSVEVVSDYLQSFFNQLGPVPFIYELKQERKKDGEDPETGKMRYVATKFYGVESISWLDEPAVKRWAKAAVRNHERIVKADQSGKEAPAAIVFKFDPAEYGFDGVELPAVETPAWAA